VKSNFFVAVIQDVAAIRSERLPQDLFFIGRAPDHARNPQTAAAPAAATGSADTSTPPLSAAVPPGPLDPCLDSCQIDICRGNSLGPLTIPREDLPLPRHKGYAED
jgi:hypothetical protein